MVYGKVEKYGFSLVNYFNKLLRKKNGFVAFGFGHSNLWKQENNHIFG